MNLKLLKKIIVSSLLILSLGMTVACGTVSKNEFKDNDTIREVTNGNNIMGFDLFKDISKSSKGENVVISPISLSMIMSLFQNGTDENSKKQILEFLKLSHLSDQQINSSNKELLNYYNSLNSKSNVLRLNNAVYLLKGFKIEDTFKQISKSFYNANVKELDFSKKSSVDEINNSVKKSTNGKIEKIIDKLDKDHRLILINTLYMNSSWIHKFDKEKTYKGTFEKGNNGLAEVEYMINNDKFKYGKFDNYEVVTLPYEMDGISMNIILPKKGIKIADFIDNFDNEKFKNSLDKLDDTYIDLRLPKFKVEYENSLNDEIKSLGVEDIFSEKANLSKIANGLFVSEILQKTYINVNESGTEAAAATKIEIKETSMPQYTKLDINRPFLFTIYDEKTNTTLFIGKIEDIK